MMKVFRARVMASLVAVSLSCGCHSEPTGTYAPTSPAAGASRIEDTDAAWTYIGTWEKNTSAPHSGGSAMVTNQTGARATVTFRGSGVRWIAYRDMFCGIARVSVDGALLDRVDTYVNDYLKAVTAYEVTDLREGMHTLTIEATGERNVASRDVQIWVDAIDPL
jgi:hypothetical protein